ncbi:MAG: transcriptional regulator GcvA [marine bacterium B5-7]|nr:MAG: transcriptional regulator GcvA [marine bacterium B5-7]
MNVRLPPTASLRALESAARHLSYTRAAEELFITQSAISHQIKHAEDIWKVKLFDRRGRNLVLTDAGKALAPVVRDFLSALDQTLTDLGRRGESASLKISMLPSFAVKWMVPRLGRLKTRCRDLEVWLSTTEEVTDLNYSDVDVAIRLGLGNWPDLYTRLLFREYVFPVCSPRFIERYGMPESPANLLRFPLLYRHSNDICPRWRDWFKSADTEIPSLPKGTRFQDTGMAVQAAIDDQGIALARSAHVADDLAEGRLIKLFNVFSPSNVAYYLVCRKGREHDTAVAGFIEWLYEEAEIAQEDFDRVGKGISPK